MSKNPFRPEGPDGNDHPLTRQSSTSSFDALKMGLASDTVRPSTPQAQLMAGLSELERQAAKLRQEEILRQFDPLHNDSTNSGLDAPAILAEVFQPKHGTDRGKQRQVDQGSINSSNGENPFENPEYRSLGFLGNRPGNEGTSGQHEGAPLENPFENPKYEVSDFPNTQGVRIKINGDDQLRSLLARRRAGEKLPENEMKRIRKFEVEIGNKYRTSKIEGWLHEQDRQFALKWRLGQKNSAEALQEMGEKLLEYWEKRQRVMGELRKAHSDSLEKNVFEKVTGSSIRKLGGIEAMKPKHKGRAIIDLIELEDYLKGKFPNPNQEKSTLKQIAINIHKKEGPDSLEKRFQDLTQLRFRRWWEEEDTLSSTIAKRFMWYPYTVGKLVMPYKSENERISSIKHKDMARDPRLTEVNKQQLLNINKQLLEAFQEAFPKTKYQSIRDAGPKMLKDVLSPKDSRLLYGNEDEKDVRKLFLDNCVEWTGHSRNTSKETLK